MMSRLAVVAALTCLSVAGCAATTAGTAAPERPSLTPPGALPAVLLPAGDAGTAMGAADLVVTREVDAPWDDSTRVSAAAGAKRGCLAITGAAQASVYSGTGWTALRGQVLREPPAAPSWSHFATQVVVLFPTATAAADFLQRSRTDWAGCADRELSYAQQPLPDQVWSVGPVDAGPAMLTVSRSQRSPQQWFCQRALQVRGNAAVDVEACDADGPTAAASAIADAVAARLPLA